MFALTEIVESIPNFDLLSFLFGLSYAVVVVANIVTCVYLVPLGIRFVKWFIEKIIFIRNRNSPPSGEDEK